MQCWQMTRRNPVYIVTAFLVWFSLVFHIVVYVSAFHWAVLFSVIFLISNPPSRIWSRKGPRSFSFLLGIFSCTFSHFAKQKGVCVFSWIVLSDKETLLVPRPLAGTSLKIQPVFLLLLSVVHVANLQNETRSLTICNRVRLEREITNHKPIRKHRRSRGKFSCQIHSRKDLKLK